jgi:hypothetical protein
MFGRIGVAVAMATMTIGCLADVEDQEDLAESASAIKMNGPLQAPTLTVVGSSEGATQLQLCAGASGAPGGFAIQAAPTSAIVDGEWPDDEGLACDAGFSGSHRSRYRLEPHECIELTLAQDDDGACALSCGVAMSYRGFAQAERTRYASAWSETAEGMCKSSTRVPITFVGDG